MSTDTRARDTTPTAAALAPTSGRSVSPDGLTQARETAEALLAAGQSADAVEFLLDALRAVLLTSRDLSLLIEKLRRGPRHSSERVNAAQLALVLEELVASGQFTPTEIDLEQEAREDAALDEEIDKVAPSVKTEGSAGESNPEPDRKRQEWQAPNIQPVVHECRFGPEERTCADCGREMRLVDIEVTKRLEFVPGRFESHEYRREKRACGYCKDAIVTADGPPPAVIAGSTAAASALAQVVVSKFADFQPLTRQQRIYAREGVVLPVSTMAGWVSEVAERITPLADLLAERVRAAFLLQTDATGMPVLDPASAANIVRGTIWCYVGDRHDVVMRYAPTGEAERGPWTFLRDRQGYVQADASNSFDRLFNGKVSSAIEVGCHAHWRRKFVTLQDVDPRVAYPIKLINRLYRVERLANAQELAPEERRVLRQDRDPPILSKLQAYCAAICRSEPPSSKLAQAASYGLNHWVALTRFLEDGRLPLDNNCCESQLRAIALTRKNTLFAGSHAAAEKMAAIFSVLRTCALRSVPPLAYLTDVLAKLASGRYADRASELLPDRWAAARNADGR